MEILRFDSLSFAYPHAEKRTLDGVQLSIETGEYVVLCGPSGCGKTTLLRHAKPSLVPTGAKEGTVRYRGKPLDELPCDIAAAEIGFVQQNPDNQIVTDFVWHELAFGLENLALPVSVIRRRVAEMAAFFGMEGWFRKKTSELSGGQKQLLNIASALAMNPKILILDEPTAMLDPLAAQNLLSMVERINRELGVAILITEHRLDTVFQSADRVAVMEDGRLLSCDSPRRIAASLAGAKDKSRVFFGLPASVRIFAELDNDDLPLSVREARRRMSDIQPKPMQIQEKELEKKPELALKAKELWFRWEENGKDILRGAEVHLNRGEILCLLGGNGAGKTTCLKVLAGAKKPYRGKVKISKGMKLCMLPQNVASLFVTDTVWDELLESAQQDEDKALHMAQKLELTALLTRHPYDLSGGETQRLAVGKLLLRDANVLLMDEPTKGLDAYAKQNLATMLQQLAKEGAAILVVTHDVEFAAQYADRCALMFDGTLLSSDEPHAFFAGNRFYTTDANRIAGDFLPDAITCEEVICACRNSL